MLTGGSEVPLTGEYVTTTTRARADGTSSTQTSSDLVFRDRQGRVRQQRGDLITITDPVAGVRYVLNTKDQTAYEIGISPPQSNRFTQSEDLPVIPGEGGGTTSATTLNESKRLGTQQVNGVKATGQEFISSIPAGSRLGNREPVQVTYQVWRSEELRLPLMVRMQSALNGETSIQFKLLQKGAEPDANLFTVPKGYRKVQAKPVTQRGQPF